MEEDILIRIRAIDEATQTIKKVSKSLGQISTSTQQLTTGFGKVQKTISKIAKPGVIGFESMEEATAAAGISMNKFSNFARMNFLEVQKGGVVMDKLTGKTMAYGVAVKQAVLQGRRFKFEWLSIMFAGMALDRAFGGLVRTQMQLWGVSEGLASMWTIVMAPAMGEITPFLWKLIDIFMDLPESVQKSIGYFVLFAAGLGTILTVVGQIVLAFMGFKILLIGIGSATSTTAVSFGALAGTIGLVVGIIALAIGFITGIILVFKNWEKISRKVKIVLYALFPTIMAVMVLIKDWGKNIDWIGDKWKAFLNIIKNVIDAIKRVSGINLIGAVTGDLRTSKKTLLEMLFGGLGSFQAGGIVPVTGPAILHRGERVIPKGRAGGGEIMFAPTVYISATITNEMDIRILATKLNEYWVRDFERIAQTRGI